ncbi:hypothetical protein ES703_93138 [subsurface metagenome]
MGHLKDITNQPNIRTFPGATFEIQGDVPIPQCSEAAVQGDNAQTFSIGTQLFDDGKFRDYALIGKKCTITISPTGNTGTFNITNKSDNSIVLNGDPGDSVGVHYYCHNGGALITTRDLPSFADFIRDAGFPYTIKGGKLYTSMPSNQLDDACKILFDPLT